ncbi:MAG: hypothetical protein JWM83_1917 [Candidatus Angelobacter sp.]|jgi:hypothetical protein|nr:hypothetical protein [Candidatus Angelobacter sp.]
MTNVLKLQMLTFDNAALDLPDMLMSSASGICSTESAGCGVPTQGVFEME